MKDENKIEYNVIFKAVESALEMKAAMLYCNQCHKGFFKITFVNQDDPDFILNDQFINENGELYCCNDHILWDLLVDPELSEPIIISRTLNRKLGRKAQVAVSKVDARLFLPKRLN